MRLSSIAARASGVHRPVYIVKTGPTLFGVHRAAESATTTTTHIIGFRRRMYADVLAESLECYRARTGEFPPRDDVAGGLDCLANVTTYAGTNVSHATGGCAEVCAEVCAQACGVEEISVAAMLARLEGTGMTLTVVYEDAAGELAWVDVRPRNDAATTSAKLRDVLALESPKTTRATEAANNAVPFCTPTSAANDEAVPPLLPKPVRKAQFSTYAAMRETDAALNGAVNGVADGMTNGTDNGEDNGGDFWVPPAMAPGLMVATAWLAAAAARRDKRVGRGRTGGILTRLFAGVLKWMTTS